MTKQCLTRFLVALGSMAILLLLASCSPQPSSAAAGGANLNVVVLCSSCGIPQASSTPHLILLDQNSGEVWAYRELNQQPVSLGKLTKLGVPAQ